MTYVQKVAARAAELEPARVALSIVAAPFYLAGLTVGVLWVVFAWAWAAVLTGVADVRRVDEHV